MKCEDCLLDNLRDEMVIIEMLFEVWLYLLYFDFIELNVLKKLYDFIIGLICDLFYNKEVIIVFDGFLCLVFYVVLVDFNFKFLSEFFRIWVIFFLISLKLIIDCLVGYYYKIGVLFIGDLCL